MSESLTKNPPFNVISDVLESLRFRGTVYFRSELAAPWGLSLPASGALRFHIMFSGECFIGSDKQKSVPVNPLEIVLLPTGEPHWIANHPDTKRLPGEEAIAACELNKPHFQNGEITHKVMCGQVQYDRNLPHPLLDSLPEILHFPCIEQDDPIWQTVQLIDRLKEASGTTQNPVIDRLSESLFLQLIIRYAERNNDGAVGFIAALRDPRVHRALTLIHRSPEKQWTLDSLSASAGMSRATMVRRFRDSVGVSPMTYLMNWRLLTAANLVKHSSRSLEQVADNVGFASARTLTKAFQRQYGQTPNTLRQKHQSADKTSAVNG